VSIGRQAVRRFSVENNKNRAGQSQNTSYSIIHKVQGLCKDTL